FFFLFFFFSSRRRHTRWPRDWSSDVCSSDLAARFLTFRWVSRRCDGDSLKVAFRHPVFQQVRFDGQLFHVTRTDGSCLTYEYVRSEERRVGKECRSRGGRYHENKQMENRVIA